MAGLSRDQLAERLQVSAETIRRREAGDSPITNEALTALAQVTNVPVGWLLKGFTDQQLAESINEVLERLEHSDDPPVLPPPDQLPGD